MKKTIAAFFFFYCIFIYQPAQAQKILSLDEMMKLAQCTAPSCFDETLLSLKYKKFPDQKMPPGLKEYINYRDTYTYANGTYNKANWTIFNDKNGAHKYVSFSFPDKNNFENLQVLLHKRGYKQVKISVKDLGNGYKAYLQFLRKNDSGILLSSNDALVYPSTKIVTYEIAITTISTPHWPDDEK